MTAVGETTGAVALVVGDALCVGNALGTGDAVGAGEEDSTPPGAVQPPAIAASSNPAATARDRPRDRG